MGFKKRDKVQKHKQSLEQHITNPDGEVGRSAPRAQKKRRRGDDEEEGDELLDAKISGRILKEARAQQEELDFEDREDAAGEDGAAQLGRGALAAALQRVRDSDSDSEGGDDWADDNYGADDAEIAPEDEAALEAFMAPGHEGYKQKSLADVILAKIREKRSEAGVAPAAGEGDVPEGLDDKVVEVYRGVGQLLQRFTVGKVPKAFKIIPNLKNWEEVLYLTEPERWSPQAVFQATKIFISNLNTRLAQRFLAIVLLPRVRREIKEKKKLHFELFQAVKKATYKPGAFYKGLLLPLCASRTCTLREAVTLTSVLQRASIPALHSAAALLRLAEMEYCGTTSFFIRVLLDKKYALPYRVIDALVLHFLRFADDERRMPVVWHQTLLCFVQRYRNEIKEEDRTALRRLTTIQHHYQVSPEVVRELDHGVARDAKGTAASAAQAMAVDATKVGQHVAEDVRNMPPVLMMDEL